MIYVVYYYSPDQAADDQTEKMLHYSIEIYF